MINIYIKSMGKVFEVTHICHTTEEANKICENNRNIGVIAEDPNHIYIAKLYHSIAASETIKQMKEVEPLTCMWSLDENVDAWETQCGECYTFITDGPVENKQKYCGYCGKIIEINNCY